MIHDPSELKFKLEKSYKNAGPPSPRNPPYPRFRFYTRKFDLKTILYSQFEKVTWWIWWMKTTKSTESTMSTFSTLNISGIDSVDIVSMVDSEDLSSTGGHGHVRGFSEVMSADSPRLGEKVRFL